MPRFDGTGPCGFGPMTGRGMGCCGAGYGRGRGFDRDYYRAPITKDQEKEMLKEEIKALQERIKELGSKK